MKGFMNGAAAHPALGKELSEVLQSGRLLYERGWGREVITKEKKGLLQGRSPSLRGKGWGSYPADDLISLLGDGESLSGR